MIKKRVRLSRGPFGSHSNRQVTSPASVHGPELDESIDEFLRSWFTKYHFGGLALLDNLGKGAVSDDQSFKCSRCSIFGCVLENVLLELVVGE